VVTEAELAAVEGSQLAGDWWLPTPVQLKCRDGWLRATAGYCISPLLGLRSASRDFATLQAASLKARGSKMIEEKAFDRPLHCID
jgi:hypothetical protein